MPCGAVRHVIKIDEQAIQLDETFFASVAIYSVRVMLHYRKGIYMQVVTLKNKRSKDLGALLDSCS